MHVLHSILVNVAKRSEKEISKNDIRYQAEEATEQYADLVYDWRETDTAGRWSGEFPCNVLLGCEEPEKINELLEEVYGSQKRKIEFALSQIKENVGSTDLCEIIKDQPEDCFDLGGFHLLQVAELHHGIYNIDSCFYDVETASAKVDKALLEKVKGSPRDYAVVLFDYHF